MKLAKSEIIQVESKKRITKTCEELKMIFEDKIGGLQQDVLSLKKSVNTLTKKIEILMTMSLIKIMVTSLVTCQLELSSF